MEKTSITFSNIYCRLCNICLGTICISGTTLYVNTFLCIACKKNVIALGVEDEKK